ncbi:MAG: type II toxin-antitoxin system HicB family antitoxin [Deltaproteobacteria bacterium]|nr:type II toxin-antitoxin system HicB family antitoxin [Deltaproteobacteria bacterium]MBW2011961.1 type II toxin-antitoxin system HicB family antitoxin [Deltaproteobacteria bacterium]
MEKSKSYYMSLNYPIQIEKVDEGYCAFIPILKGCKAFGQTADEAVKELEAVKEGFFEIFIETGKVIPEPVVHIDIPHDVFVNLSCKEELEPYISC